MMFQRIPIFRMQLKVFIVFLIIYHAFGDILNGSQTSDSITQEKYEDQTEDENSLPINEIYTSKIEIDHEEIYIPPEIEDRINNLINEENKSSEQEDSDPKIEVLEPKAMQNDDFETGANEIEPLNETNYSGDSFVKSSREESLSLGEILKSLKLPLLSSIGHSAISEEKVISSELDSSVTNNETSGSDTPTAVINSSETNSLNVTESNRTNSSSQPKKATCIEIEFSENIGDVEVVNSTSLQKALQNNVNITTRSTPAQCYLVYFFSPYCPFSTQGSAYVNALARSLPNIRILGLDSIEYHSLNARYGIMGTPSLVLFHNGNVAGRYNASEFSTFYLESFIHHFTDQKITSINVTSHDFKSNLPSQVLPSTPYSLYFAWTFLLTCGGCLFLNSEFYAKLTEAVLNNWREAEAQHEHDE